jgi:hypothetical protein
MQRRGPGLIARPERGRGTCSHAAGRESALRPVLLHTLLKCPQDAWQCMVQPTCITSSSGSPCMTAGAAACSAAALAHSRPAPGVLGARLWTALPRRGNSCTAETAGCVGARVCTRTRCAPGPAAGPPTCRAGPQGAEHLVPGRWASSRTALHKCGAMRAVSTVSTQGKLAAHAMCPHAPACQASPADQWRRA